MSEQLPPEQPPDTETPPADTQPTEEAQPPTTGNDGDDTHTQQQQPDVGNPDTA